MKRSKTYVITHKTVRRFFCRMENDLKSSYRCHATANGDEKAVKASIDAKSDLKIATETSFEGQNKELIYAPSLLNTAIRFKQIAIVKQLVEVSADMFASGPAGIYNNDKHALLYAIDKGLHPILAEMVKHAKNIDLRIVPEKRKYDLKYSALAYAVEMNDVEAVKILLNAKANPKADLDRNFTLTDLAKLLREKGRVSQAILDLVN